MVNEKWEIKHFINYTCTYIQSFSSERDRVAFFIPWKPVSSISRFISLFTCTRIHTSKMCIASGEKGARVCVSERGQDGDIRQCVKIGIHTQPGLTEFAGKVHQHVHRYISKLGKHNLMFQEWNWKWHHCVEHSGGKLHSGRHNLKPESATSVETTPCRHVCTWK